ncbi:MAG: prepilin-type N-terminal cleavage/methylation domain-containing protein [Verrucomicrobiota bacterium]
MKEKHLGFSLIELLVSMTVVSVLAAITVVGVGHVRTAVHRTAEVTGARQLISAYLIYPQDNGGRLMPAVPDSREIALNPVRDHAGNAILNGAVASRYPFRILPYLGDVRSLYSGQFAEHLDDLRSSGDPQYGISLYPSLGLNSEYMGGNYDDRRTHPETGFYPGLAVTRLEQVMDPSKQIVFVSSTYGKEPGSSADYVGFHRVEAPKGLRTSWSSYNEELPAQMGYIHLRYERQALVAHLDGSVGFMDEESLGDMRRWSNQARLENDENFRPSRSR